MNNITKEQTDIAYESGRPLLTDAEYDKKFGINATAMTTKMPITQWVKHLHKIPMASLTKIKLDTWDLFFKWCANVINYIGTWKYDGLAVELEYVDNILINGSTRGDGLVGDNITENILKMKGVVKKLPCSEPFTGSIKGEIIMCKDDFATYLSETKDKKPYSNTRNGAAGAATAYDGHNCKYLTIKYYDVSLNLDELSKFEWLKKIFDIEYYELETYESIKDFYYKMEINRTNINFDVDGIVLAINSKEYQKERGLDKKNKPKWKVALKFQHLVADSKVNFINWSNGNTGAVTPVANIEPVDLGGVTVSKVSVANWQRVKDLNLCIGDRVIVSRRNDVIPYIEENLDKDKETTAFIPIYCPVCKCELKIDGPILYCVNNSCKSLEIGNLKKWTNEIKEHFKVKGIGPERIDEMYELGIVKYLPDLYTVTNEMLLDKMSNIGIASASRILDYQKYKEIPLDIFLAGLNIKGLGKAIWNLLIEKGFNNLRSILNSNVSDLIDIDGIGEERASIILNELKKKEILINNLFNVGIKIVLNEKKLLSNTLNGKSFCITGTLSRSRDELVALIIGNCGVIKSGVSKNLDYLVAGEDCGSKLQKAEKLNINIISEDKLLNLIG